MPSAPHSPQPRVAPLSSTLAASKFSTEYLSANGGWRLVVSSDHWEQSAAIGSNRQHPAAVSSSQTGHAGCRSGNLALPDGARDKLTAESVRQKSKEAPA